MRVLALAAAAKQIYKRRIAVLDERIEAVKASMAARRKQAIAMAAAVVAAGEAATEPRRHVRRALGKWRGSTVGVYLADGDQKTFKDNFRCTKETFSLLATLLSSSAFATAEDLFVVEDVQLLDRVVVPYLSHTSPLSRSDVWTLTVSTLRDRALLIRIGRTHCEIAPSCFHKSRSRRHLVRSSLVLDSLARGGRPSRTRERVALRQCIYVPAECFPLSLSLHLHAGVSLNSSTSELSSLSNGHAGASDRLQMSH